VTRETVTIIQSDQPFSYVRLSDNGAGSSGLVLPGGRENTDSLVVTGQSVDTGLNENETELGVLILAVTLKVLADGNSLLDEHVQILGELGSEAC
jgi:hypothetical protein